jgi:flagellar biosynthesis chaperone FliJ
MTTNIQLPPQLAPASTPAQTGAPQQGAASAGKTSSAILGGANVTVSAGGTDLDKLLEQLKNENANTRLALARQRIAAIVTILTRLSDGQARILSSISDMETALAAAKAEEIVMQSEIERLEQAVKQNIEDAKLHREQVQELKELREKQQAKLDGLENADVRDDAAIAAAKAALEGTDKALASANAALAAVLASQAANQSALDAEEEKLSPLEARVSDLESKISAAFGSLDETTVGKLAAALLAESKVNAGEAEETRSPAEEKKEERKAAATDPTAVIRGSLDRIDELLEAIRTIKENQPIVG